MKKMILTAVIAASFSNAIFATDCLESKDWVITDHFAVTMICKEKNISCTLVDVSGGNPEKHTFFENIDWTFIKENGGELTSSCKAYPMNQNCDFNRPTHTCAYLYRMHVV